MGDAMSGTWRNRFVACVVVAACSQNRQETLASSSEPVCGANLCLAAGSRVSVQREGAKATFRGDSRAGWLDVQRVRAHSETPETIEALGALLVERWTREESATILRRETRSVLGTTANFIEGTVSWRGVQYHRWWWVFRDRNEVVTIDITSPERDQLQAWRDWSLPVQQLTKAVAS